MTSEKAETKDYLKAIRLINIENDDCAFEIGRIPVLRNIKASFFFAKTNVSALEGIPHPAPRRQYVITLKGKLKFGTTNGETFMIEPGIILIANDTRGSGHTWEIGDGDEWVRIYIPLDDDTDDLFIVD
ncbi:hypothetical protein GJU39_04100 [Pedobacter petrophilus]|uniref:Cupin domain-containing protein n=1 Tax=Pedobacter petrophilus TaxID=1908241 RepID=A0A7K0FV87_9SPHI|nr:hypothetical protein [Pedobacter petrophilus]MRX75262.1 hypothetical protein [Pedobacter petrophilus]